MSVKLFTLYHNLLHSYLLHISTIYQLPYIILLFFNSLLHTNADMQCIAFFTYNDWFTVDTPLHNSVAHQPMQCSAAENLLRYLSYLSRVLHRMSDCGQPNNSVYTVYDCRCKKVAEACKVRLAGEICACFFFHSNITISRSFASQVVRARKPQTWLTTSPNAKAVHKYGQPCKHAKSLCWTAYPSFLVYL